MKRVIVFIGMLALFAFAKDVAIVKKVSGSVIVKRGLVSQDVKKGDKLRENDVIITKDPGAIGILFDDGTALALGKNSIISINKYIFKPASKEYAFDLKMNKGVASFQSGKIGKLSPKSVHFNVPEGMIGIRGTKFYVEVK